MPFDAIFVECEHVSNAILGSACRNVAPVGRRAFDTHGLKVMTVLGYYTAYLHVIKLTLIHILHNILYSRLVEYRGSRTYRLFLLKDASFT